MEIHRYTKEEQEFMKQYVPGHSHREIQQAFCEQFGWNISINQVKTYIKNHKLNTGRTGRFEKGHVPANKGEKGVCAEGCKKTWFKKGNIQVNHRSVGSERINKDGYIEIKVEEPNKWRLKHRVVWEMAHGEIPKDHVIIFKDNDKTNTDIDNLILTEKGVNATLNKTGLCKMSGEFKETAILIAQLNQSNNKARKREK